MNDSAQGKPDAGDASARNAALGALSGAKDDWARTSVCERIEVLGRIGDAIMAVARDWAHTAAREKGIAPDSPLVGEEWLSGPYAIMETVNALRRTLAGMDGKAYLRRLATRRLGSSQTAVRVMPTTIWDRLLMSGIRAEVWMKPGVTPDNLADHAASAYDGSAAGRRGKVALVLGAGNIAAIAPLDVLHKLFVENQVVILKMNPVNDYLTGYLQTALAPLIARDALRIVRGDGAVGAELCTHPLVDEIHVTGSVGTHDAIVWGTGDEAQARRRAGTPLNPRRITSELGSVSPTIVVPGPWSRADIRFQAQHIATQKLHNAGHNCISCQALIMPRGWDVGPRLLNEVRKIASAWTRSAHYPGSDERLARFSRHSGGDGGDDGHRAGLIAEPLGEDGFNARHEVFAPALGLVEIKAENPQAYLRDAIQYANTRLGGTLGANILIHPRTLRRIGKTRFEEILADFRYGTIAVNGWSALGFLFPTCPWGAFPGHSIGDVGSGIGTVHNAFMLNETERVVLTAPWRPFPRSLLGGRATLLPRPPYFITNRKQRQLGQVLTTFSHRPRWRLVPRILVNALLG